MPYVEPAEIERVKQIDLLTYLEQCEPDELVKLGIGTYCTKTHDSLKISNGQWYWWSRGFGGRSALDYLIKVKGMTFLGAVGLLGARGRDLPMRAPEGVKLSSAPRKELALPVPAASNDAAIAYLKSRGIDESVVEQCIKNGSIYASEKNGIINVVFVGADNSGAARYAALRGVAGDFKGEAVGSDKEFAFRLSPRFRTEDVHVFEGAIDALSFATLMLNTGRDWRDMSLLSLGGISPTAANGERTLLSHALAQYFMNNIQTKKVFLHLDNDEPGTKAALAIAASLPEYGFQADAVIAPPPKGKDVNEYLMMSQQVRPAKAHDHGQAR